MPDFSVSIIVPAVIKLKAMNWKNAFAALILLIGYDFACSQQIPSTTTAAELWNPWTWFWPYAIATAEGFRDYYQKAQKATNELYQQAYKTNAFPWITGNGGDDPSKGNEGGNNGQQGGQANQEENGNQITQGNNTQTEKPVEENQPTGAENAETGAQIQGNVNGNETGNAEISGNV